MTDPAATKALRLERRPGGLVHIQIDSPGESVNTLKESFADEMSSILDELEADAMVTGIVLCSTKPESFVAGADISMIEAVGSVAEATRLAKRGQAVVSRLAAFSVPIVAAISGGCLGGGLELALACAGRVAASSAATKFGLPEVQLGILPGLGGTQRLPALIGLSAALDLLLTGRQLDARRAQKLGLVDEVVAPEHLLTMAERRASQLAGAKKRGSLAALRELLAPAELRELALSENPLGRKVVFDQARKKLLERTHGNYPAPEKILDVVRRGLERDLEAGLHAEAEAFGELALTPEAKALRHVFFSQQASKKDTGTESSVSARPLRQVGVLGGGLMGAGIAYVSATAASCHVRIKEVSHRGVTAALLQLDRLLEERVERRRLTPWEKESALARVTRTLDYSGFDSQDVIIEAVFEDLELKRRVLREVERLAPETTVFASNTSALPIGAIAREARHPERVLGMHYFSPVHKMPLLEVVTTDKTADWAVRTAVALGKKQGKTVIVVRDGAGFYTTRILGPYLNEAAYLLMEGWPVEVVDRAMVQAGFPVGPLVLLDEIGIDVGSKVAEILEEAFGSRVAPPKALLGLVEAERRGRKNRKGFYDYSHKRKGDKPVDHSVYADLGLPMPGRDEEAEDGRQSHIVERCLLAMVNEAFHCMGDGILRQERDGDIGAIFGLGFPPFLGGPFHYVRSRGPREVLSRLQELEQTCGRRFSPAPHLVRLAQEQPHAG